MNLANGLEQVIEYHEGTKHHLDRYARSLGYLDWANQPDPFRRYEGAPKVRLAHPDEADSPPYDDIFSPGKVPARSMDRASVSRLFYDSLSLSAWKQTPGSDRWALRVNPSSGNLHPTEAYLICGPLAGIGEEPGIYHYSPVEHALERLFALTMEEWSSLTGDNTSEVLFVALTSIYWREAWKYGERAFRYCNHDVGHALGALSLAAASLGWFGGLIETVSDDDLGRLLFLESQDKSEAEHPDCLVMISTSMGSANVEIPSTLLQRLSRAECLGQPNQLSKNHHPWPAIDQVSELTRYSVAKPPTHKTFPKSGSPNPDAPGSSSMKARRLFRQRRSAVAMDPSGSIGRPAFFRIMARLTLGRMSVPFSLLPWSPLVSLLLFVHRVRELRAGVYLLIRDSDQQSLLRASLRAEFLWKKPEGCPEDLDLFLLEEGDCRNAAKIVSCHQGIAADGVFSLGMLSRFEPVLQENGASFYRRLHWECGLIGQLLYLEAEAAGIRGTGIGCFHDDLLHQFLGLEDRAWQTLYHFTVGKSLEDFRLQTIPAYEHLKRQ